MKENLFSKKMSEKTIEELHMILASKSYTEDAKNAATWELEKRSELPPSEEKPQVAEVDELSSVPGSTATLNYDDDDLLDTSEEGMPELYRQKMIYLFCMLFSAIFGAVIYAMNLYRLKKINEMYMAIGFGILYTVLVVYAVAYVPQLMNMGLILNGGAGIIINEVFWNKQIGKDFKFAPRNVGIPIVVGVAVTVGYIFLLIYSV